VTPPANPGGPLNESLVGAVQVSGGAADAGKLVVLDSSGMIDSSMISGLGSTVSVNGILVSSPDFTDGDILWQATGSIVTATVNALATTGLSVVTSTSAPPAHAGQLLISQPGNTSAAWADPLVQGVQAAGTAASTVNPVLIGGRDASGLLQDFTMTAAGSPPTEALNVYVVNQSGNASNVTVVSPLDSSGYVEVDLKTALPAGTNAIGHVVTDTGSTTAVTGTVSVTQSTSPWVVSLASTTVSGTVAVTQSTSPWVVSNPVLSGMSFTSYGSPATENLNVYVVNPVTATFTETQIGVTQLTSPWAVSGAVTYVTTVPSLTNGQSVAQQCDATGSNYVNTEGRKATYSAVNSATGSPPAGGIYVVIPGNATTTVRVTRVEVSLSTTGTAGVETVLLQKLSSAPTGGTSYNLSVVPHDTNFGPADSTPICYTAAPTGGALVGNIRALQFFDESSALAGSSSWLWEFGTRGGAAAIVLRGTAQCLAINIVGIIATQTATVSIEWTEDNS
jgi:hypothetical protein